MSLNRFNVENYKRHVMAPGSTYCHGQRQADERSLIVSNCQQESGGYEMRDLYRNLTFEIYNTWWGSKYKKFSCSSFQLSYFQRIKPYYPWQ